MTEKSLWTLTVDPEFKSLIRPLYKQEYMLLEESLLEEGCRNPVVTWNGIIVDGHNRYEICTRLKIPFSCEAIDFENRESAIAWICKNQLGRRNLTEETRKFLIGMLYESEKVVNAKKNASGNNQHSKKKDVPYEEFNPNQAEPEVFSKRKTAQRIAVENHISHGTVEKYAIYTRALEEIGKKVPDLVPKILSGKYKISHNAILELAKRPEKEIQEINKRLELSQQPFAQYHITRDEIMRPSKPKITISGNRPHSVKDMPAFDPDAEITGLNLTIPSWISSMKRIMSETNSRIISSKARKQIINSLYDLENTITEMLIFVEEEK